MPSDMWAMGMSLFIKCYRNNEILFDSTEEHRKYYSKMKKFPLEKFQLYDWAIPYKNNIEDYLRKILVIDPSKRLTAEEALQHPLFANLPEQEGLTKQPYSISYKPIDENVMLRIINTMGKALNQLPNHEDLPILILDYIYRLLAVSKLSKNDPEQLIICTGIIICSLLNLDYDKKFYKEKNSVAALLSRDVPFYNDNLLSLCKNSKEKAYLYKKYYCQPKAFFSLVCKNAIVPNIKEDIETMETVISRIKLEI
jgi:serine/threonine protein kinase